jgi:phosphoserine aminotransferase
VGSSRDDNFLSIQKDITVAPTASYLHLTTNETIAGTQWHQLPYDCGVPIVADMSSDIFSRVLDFNKFGIIYAGAQKNMGAAGVNLVVVNKNLLGKSGRSIPTILDYRNHINEGSMLNTPPVFAVFVALLTLKWLKKKGGIKEMEKQNEVKSALLYETLDRLPIFLTDVKKEDRSKMNIVFRIGDPENEKEFSEICKKEGLIGIKGHRSVGGFRASVYNAMPLEGVQTLVQILEQFAESKS